MYDWYEEVFLVNQVVLTKDYSALASILSVTWNGKVADY